jgi:large subunit ribosomal protein L17
MRHRKKTLKLNRHPSHMRAMLANMVRSLFLHEAITTTLPKAKGAKPLAEKMISLGKKNDLAARRQAIATLHDEVVVKKLFSEIAPKFNDRTGGYTRIIRAGFRAGDGANMAILELVGRVVQPKVTVPAAEKAEKKTKAKEEAKAVAQAEAKK